MALKISTVSEQEFNFNLAMVQEGEGVTAICHVMFLKDNIFTTNRTLAKARISLHGISLCTTYGKHPSIAVNNITWRHCTQFPFLSAAKTETPHFTG